MRGRIGFSAALAGLLALAAGASQAMAGEAAVGDLIGLSPVEVRARLTGAPAQAPLTRGFEVSFSGGTDAYFTLDQLVADPRRLRQQAIWRTHGDGPLDPEAPVCRTHLASGLDGSRGGDPVVGDPVLAFRDGRLAAVLRPAPASPRSPAPSIKDRKAYERWVRQSRSSPFTAAFGRLPLEDGRGFLGRWSAGVADPGERLSATCAPGVSPAVGEPVRRRGLSNSDMQGLALLPFAVKLPAMNRDRERAREQGAATLAGLSVGQRLPRDPKAFAREQDGLRWHGSARADYGVLTVDLGGWKSRNLSDKRDAALVGVEDGVVTWISPPGGAGPDAGLLCVDGEGQAGAPRPGCWGWGNYRP